MRDDRDIISQRCMRLTEKVCVVTGAGQGIGRATARRLGAEGAEVIIAERNEFERRCDARANYRVRRRSACGRL